MAALLTSPPITPAMRRALQAMPPEQREDVLSVRRTATRAAAPPAPRQPRISRSVRATAPLDDSVTEVPEGSDPVAFAAAIADPLRRLKAAADLLYAHLERAEKLRELRYALAFSGVDRFWPDPEFAAARHCLARDREYGPLCTEEHVGRGLCLKHLRRFKAGMAWGPDEGLFMDHPPFETKWRKRALDAAGVENWVLQRDLAVRRWPLEHGEGWTTDPLEARESDRTGRWWRYVGLTDSVVEIGDEVPDYPNSQMHWKAYGDCHREIVAVENVIERLRALRREALFVAFGLGTATSELAALSGMLENNISKLRGEWQRGLSGGEPDRVPAGSAPLAVTFSGGHAGR
jgi:hypothetical protein